MLDPRIYRTAFVAVILAVIVFAFSLGDAQGPLHTTLAPQAFNGATAYSELSYMARKFPDRAPGSAVDDSLAPGTLASYIEKHLNAGKNVSVSTQSYEATTTLGTRTLTTITALNPGLSSGAIVIVAPRDSAPGAGQGAPTGAELSGTAVLLQLATVLHEQSLKHSVMLVSTSGTAGGAGAVQLARQLAGQPVDAVIVLGDLLARYPSQPVVVPWSSTDTVAPTALRNTAAAALRVQAGVRSSNPGIPAQIARLAFPLTLSAQ